MDSNHENGLSAQDKETAKKDGYNEKANPTYFWQKRSLKVTVSGWQYCCAFALAGVMSGQFGGYNPGLFAGVAGFTVCLILVSLGYIFLGACIGELASAIPFCGGSYGYTRFVFGKFPGYVIGVIESFEYFCLITTTVYSLGSLVSLFTGLDDRYLPLWWLIMYAVMCFLVIRGGKLMWNIAAFLCVFNILVLVIFFFATTKWMDMSKNARLPGDNPWFTTDASVFFESFSYAMWFFIGIEVIPMISEEVDEPHKNVPKGIRGAVWILAFFSFLIMLTVSSLPPPDNGDLMSTAIASYPCQQGWALVFGNNSNLIMLFSFLPLWNNAYAITIGASRQLFAMSRSGYLPSPLSLTSERGSPYVACILLTISGFVLCIIALYSPNPIRFSLGLFNVTTICGISNYVVQLICFVVWRFRHSSIARQYRSPYGVPGALFAICIFVIGLSSMFAYTMWISDAVIAIIVFLVIATTYYVVYARYHLTLSPEEIHALFPVYSFMVLEKKWKKTHTRRQSTGSEENTSRSKGHSTSKSRNELPAVQTQETPGKDTHGEKTTTTTAQPFRFVFNPFMKNPVHKQQENESIQQSHTELSRSESPYLHDDEKPLVLDMSTH